MAKVRCDTCGIRTVDVGDDYDGTEYVACAACLGDEPEASSKGEDSALDLRVDALIHADIEERAS
jgi:hypothetical protein